MIPHDHSRATMSTNEHWWVWCYGAMSGMGAVVPCSWMFPNAHDCCWCHGDMFMSFMVAYECHQCSRVAIGAMVPCSWVFICIHEHVHGANSTHEHGPMVPTALVSLNEHTTMTLIPLIAPWQHKGCTKKNALKLAQQFLLNFSSYKHDRQLGHNSFEKWDP